VVHGSPHGIIARIRTAQHGIIEVRRRHLAESSFERAADGSVGFRLRFKNGEETFTGRDAERVAALVMPKVNRFGGKKAEVADAVKEIESFGHPEAFLHTVGDRTASLVKPMHKLGRRRGNSKSEERQFHKYGLYSLPAAQRLAIEMALHEEAERRALEGELAELEQAWKDAEEVAAIADNLFVPGGVDEHLRRLKGDG
jgi:hypothetical protein